MNYPTLCLLLLLPFAACGADLYVSPTGDDANPGTAAQPLRTLTAARDKLQPKLATMDRDLTVQLAGGTWYLDQPLELGPEDSGRNGHDVVWTGEQNDLPVLLGGRQITGWTKRDDGLWVAQVPPGTVCQQLFLGGRRMRLAQSPNDGYFEVEAPDDRDPNKVFGYRDGDLPPGPIGPEAKVFVWASYDWFTSTCRIAEIDRFHRVVTLRDQPLGQIVKRAHRRYRFIGFRGALDAPGEFFLDQTSGELWLIPDQGTPVDQPVVLPMLDSVVSVVGQPDQPVEHVRFEHLKLGVTRFDERFNEIDGTHGKTAWNEPANLNGVIHLKHARDVTVDSCEISNAGYSGVSVIGLSQRVTVQRCWIHNCGYHGVLLLGAAPRLGENLGVHREHRVLNSHLEHCGRLVGQGAGVFLHSTAANRIANCLIHDLPRYGICGKGGAVVPQGEPYEVSIDGNPLRDNVFEDNDIHHVNQDSEDSGFISFHTTGRGNVVRRNLLHDCVRDLGGLSFAIYLDDGAGYFDVSQNVIWNIAGGSPGRCMPIYAKGIYNTIENNILVAEENTGAAVNAAYMFSRRGDHHRYLHNIVDLTRGDGVAWRHSNWVKERLTECDRNLFWRPDGEVKFSVKLDGQPLTSLSLADWRDLAGRGFDQHSQVADPQFVDAAAHDYRLQPGSPAYAVGFQAIDTSQCGLRDDFPWPVADGR